MSNLKDTLGTDKFKNKTTKLVKKDCEILKADVERGLLIGYACFDRKYDVQKGWYDFEDSDKDILETEAIFDLFETYMEENSDRVMLLNHKGEKAGRIVSVFPLTVEVAEALEIDITKSGSGLLSVLKPDNMDDVLDDNLFCQSIGFYIDEYEMEDD